ncbi:MAG TPA: penicillin-binding protein 1C [Burkholderiaceae bacterium]|nr:penicillin-binding protein 1C [Burkholderiaceae bacterium]
MRKLTFVAAITRVARVGVLVLIIGALSVSLSTAIIAALTPTATFDEIRHGALGSESTLLSRDGEPLQRLRVDMTRRQLEWTALDSISPSVVRAVVAAEDHRFWWHFGFDPASGVSALMDQFGGRGRGASTITMQLAGLLTEGDRFGRRSLDEKLAQFRYAIALEHRWSKQQIVEAYLNLVPLRGELVGIRAASLGLFGHAPDALDEAESAVIAALVRSPSASRSVLARRACSLMNKTDKPEGCARAETVAATLPSHPLAMSGLDEAPHLARRLLTRAGTSVRSTLDASLQRFAAETLRNRLASLADRNVEDGAVVVLDNVSGDVLAYIGSSGDMSGAAAVDGAAALRQPGSTLKPFLYGVAIEQRWLTAASLLDDAPLALTTPNGLYVPQNYDRDFKGAVSVRSALAASLNVPAVRTLQLVGVERFRQTLQSFGMSSVKHDGEYYGYGLALGGGDTSLLALANAYRALANAGAWSPAHLQMERGTSGGESVRVLSAEASFIISDILADSAARASTFGLASPLSARSWAAVKTGTSKGMRDNWAIGYTDRYTVGVWVGNFSGAPMWDVSGVTGAAPIWREIVDHLHANQSSRAPNVPAGVVQREVVFAPTVEPVRREWFVAGTESTTKVTTISLPTTEVAPRVLAPADGTVIAPDPDIPAARQSMLIRAEAPQATRVCLKLGAQSLAPCGIREAMVKLPPPGRHQIRLETASGALLAQAIVEVRGVPR